MQQADCYEIYSHAHEGMNPFDFSDPITEGKDTPILVRWWLTGRQQKSLLHLTEHFDCYC